MYGRVQTLTCMVEIIPYTTFIRARALRMPSQPSLSSHRYAKVAVIIPMLPFSPHKFRIVRLRQARPIKVAMVDVNHSFYPALTCRP